MIEISQASDVAAVAAARDLFREYQTDLGVDLCFQGFSAELDGLPGDYASPTGRLFLAHADDALAGCVALRALGTGGCEMKRLFVRPPFRKAGVGRRLVERVIGEARAIGYDRLHLDTLPSMESAQRLYQSLGFRETTPYRENPVPGARFFVLGL